MTLTKFNRPATRSFNNFFDEFLNDLPVAWNKEFGAANFPPVNIVETSDAYHVELSAPGRNKEDFSINLENGLLTISYEKKEEKVSEEFKTVRKEFSYQSFKRSFTLDDKVNIENIQAKYENGLLKLLLPKKEQVKESTKQISIQ